jgi:hypothetical protein
VTLKQMMGWIGFALVLWWVVTEPQAAAHVVHRLGDLLSVVATGLGQFASDL